MISALYVHVPFCETICPFCAFAVHGNRDRLHAPYLSALLTELERTAAEHAAALGPLDSVYVGGGTPSTLSLPEVEALLTALRRHMPLAADCELAFELNPEHAKADYLDGLAALGVTRTSLGLQSLDDGTLRALGRHNTAAQGHAALEALLTHGPHNANVDLMFGAPYQPPAAFQADVDAVVDRAPQHISLYGLDIEQGTPFGRDKALVRWAMDQRDVQAAQYEWAVERLTTAGYRHYEVSNFCLPGFEGRQNLIVWDGGAYLGIGPGAHSYADTCRWHNERHLPTWLKAIERGRSPVAHRERLTPSQQANEALMLALRRDSGLDTEAWSTDHAVRWSGRQSAIVDRLVREGRARRDGSRIALTPGGLLLADELAAALAVD